MLTINAIQYEENCPVLFLWSYNFSGSQCRLSVMYPSSVKSQSEQNYTGSPPNSSYRPDNQFGDKNCHHFKVDGLLTTSNLVTVRDAGPRESDKMDYPRYLYETGVQPSYDYTVTVGSSLTVRDTLTGYHIELLWLGNAYLASRTYDIWATRSYPDGGDSRFKIVATAYGSRFSWYYSIGRNDIRASDLDLQYVLDHAGLWSFSRTDWSARIVVSNDVSVLPDHLPEYFKLQHESYSPVVSDVQDIYGRLANDIVSDESFPQVNIPLYLRDLLKTPADILKLARSVRHADIKSLSDAYLSYKYGVSLTVRDSLELGHALMRALPKFGWSSRKAHTTTFEVTSYGHRETLYAYKVYFSNTPNESVDLIESLWDTDVLGLGNAWDSVPFSFVVDWFTNIGDVLEQLDSTSRYNTLQVLSTVRTIKTVDVYDDSLTLQEIFGLPTPVTGAVQVSCYNRLIEPKLITPRIAWEAPSQFNHFLESSALITSTQYKRRR